MKVLVTGGSGFLATNIIRELTARGHVVRAMIRAASSTLTLDEVNVDIIRGDITDEVSVSEAIRGCDYVIHTAADTSQHYHSYIQYLPVNYRGTLNILNACVKHKVKRLVYISTANTLGHGSIDIPGDELHDARFPFNRSGYAISKALAEGLVKQFVDRDKIDAVIVNPSFMIGPFDSKPGSGRIITRAFKQRVVIVPPGGKSFVNVKDVAAASCNALTLGRSGERYLLTGRNMSYTEFYKELRNISGERYHIIRLPALLLSVFGAICNFSGFFGIKSDLNYINSRILCTCNYFTAEKAVRELGYKTSPLDKAIAEAIDWFWENSYLKN